MHKSMVGARSTFCRSSGYLNPLRAPAAPVAAPSLGNRVATGTSLARPGLFRVGFSFEEGGRFSMAAVSAIRLSISSFAWEGL
jgi:hypothetical protein